MRVREHIPDFVAKFKGSGLMIDEFLNEKQEEYHLVGRAAVLIFILKYEHEQESGFREETPGGKDEDWYTLLFKAMSISGSKLQPLEEFPENKVAFITFNYDRSLEHFLYSTLTCAYDERAHEIKNNVKRFLPFKFIHVYDQVDKPEWDGGIEYGQPFDRTTIRGLMGNIRLIGERTDDDGEKIRELLEWAKKIYFLGFGYADENLDAIGIRTFISGGTRGTHIYGTARGKTPDEIERTKKRFHKEESVIPFSLIDKYIKLEPVGCYKLLDYFPLV